MSPHPVQMRSGEARYVLLTIKSASLFVATRHRAWKLAQLEVSRDHKRKRYDNNMTLSKYLCNSPAIEERTPLRFRATLPTSASTVRRLRVVEVIRPSDRSEEAYLRWRASKAFSRMAFRCSNPRYPTRESTLSGLTHLLPPQIQREKSWYDELEEEVRLRNAPVPKIIRGHLSVPRRSVSCARSSRCNSGSWAVWPCGARGGQPGAVCDDIHLGKHRRHLLFVLPLRAEKPGDQDVQGPPPLRDPVLLAEHRPHAYRDLHAGCAQETLSSAHLHHAAVYPELDSLCARGGRQLLQEHVQGLKR
eukprot:scaffold1350_cov249-Pinguiococcus_pyrenoidosus.AAC.7